MTNYYNSGRLSNNNRNKGLRELQQRMASREALEVKPSVAHRPRKLTDPEGTRSFRFITHMYRRSGELIFTPTIVT
jgi:hypothetical protein